MTSVAPTPKLEPVSLELPGGTACLAPLSVEHAAGLLAAADESIWRYIFPPYAPATSTLEGMEAMIRGSHDAQARGVELPFVILDAASRRPIGSTRYLDVQHQHRALEIGGTWIARSHQRSCVNTECKYLLLRHAFESIWRDGTDAHRETPRGALRVQLKCDARNVRSQAAMLRIGAKYEGPLRRSRILADGFVRDACYFSVIREEWAGVKAMLESKLGLAAG